MYECDLAKERVEKGRKAGYCLHKRIFCDGSGCVPLNEKCEKIEKKDICKKSSIFGNYYIGLTSEQIEAIQNGEVFAILDEEYNIFIGRRGDDNG